MKFNFIPLSRPFITDDEIIAVKEVLESGFLTTGRKVEEFESQFARFIGDDIYAVALSSCTAGLFLSLLVCGVKEGDEVIVPTWTFVATSHVVLWCGARPVLCDVEEETLNIDVGQMERLVTSRTKAIIPVHFAGYPCKMDEIVNIANRYRLMVIEDAAHAIGTEYKGTKIGNFGHTTCFSFYATKNLTTAEGGMVVSKDRDVIEKIRKLSYFGINKEAFFRYTQKGSWFYEVEDLGYKFNMDNIHAAIGLVQLKKVEKMNARRREIANMYREAFSSNPNIKLFEDLPMHRHSYHLFPIRINRKVIRRDEFILKLKERNIGCSVHFIPLHLHPFYSRKFNKDMFPVANKVYQEVVSLPIYPQMRDEDVYYVIENVNKLLS